MKSVKFCLVAIFLLSSCIYCLGEDKFSNKDPNFKHDRYLKTNPAEETLSDKQREQKTIQNTNPKNKKVADEMHYNYIGNPDIDDTVVRPCPVYDLHCIRRFFAKHAHCTITYGPIPDSISRSQSTAYFPRVNLTVIINNMVMSGLKNTRIEEFYINKATNKMVFAININNFTHNSPDVYFSFSRRGREPIVTVAPSGIFFPSVTFTAIIPFIDDIQLEKAEVTAYCDTAVVPFYIGAQAANSTDPTVALSLAQLPADIPTSIQEYFLTQALFYPPFYIQHNICDFGLKVL